MTYCCGILVRDGLVMIADTRTNAGLDNVSTFRKLLFIELLRVVNLQMDRRAERVQHILNRHWFTVTESRKIPNPKSRHEEWINGFVDG